MKVSYLPIYDTHFPKVSEEGARSPARMQDWTQFISARREDFNAPLSQRPADFTIHNTFWGKAQNALGTALKIAIITYIYYPFVGWLVYKPVAAALSYLPCGALITMLQKTALVHVLSAWCHPTLLAGAGYVGALVFKVLCYYKSVQYIAQRFVMFPLYPAQNGLVKAIMPHFETHKLNTDRFKGALSLKSKGFIVRDVNLEKNGIRYSGLLIAHEETIGNRQWVLQATGNAQPIEQGFVDIDKQGRYIAEEGAPRSNFSFSSFYQKQGFNLLLINGPGVGKSEGKATAQSMGDAQQVGISFIETALKANKIVIAGFSLGGAAIGQAILQHAFKGDVKYLVVRQMTFDRVSTICAKIVARASPFLEKFVVKQLIKWTGLEIDSVAASKKLQQLGIQEVIVQRSAVESCQSNSIPCLNQFETDGVIVPEASLGYALVKEGVTEDKVFCPLPEAEHDSILAFEAAGPHIKAL
jgi:hypothetical protein